MLLLLLLLLLALAAGTATAADCAYDCGLNGDCQPDGSCRCYAGWSAQHLPLKSTWLATSQVDLGRVECREENEAATDPNLTSVTV